MKLLFQYLHSLHVLTVPRLRMSVVMFSLLICLNGVHRCFKKVKVKVKQSHYRPRGFQEVKFPRFRDNGTGWW
jgi:hypothetical protein